MPFDTLLGATGIYYWGSHMSFLPEVTEMTPFCRENQFHKFPRNAVFLSNHQESYSPGEPVSGYLGFLEGMEFPLDLTEQVPPRQSAQRGGLSDGANSCPDCSWLPGGGSLSLSLCLNIYSNLPLHPWFPTFLMLQPFTVPHVVVTPAIKLFLLLLRN